MTHKTYDEHLLSIIETATDAIISTDSKGIVVIWNKAAAAMFGVTAKEMIGNPVTMIIPERFRGDHTKRINELANGAPPNLIGKTIEIAAIRSDGQEFPIELSLSMWKAKNEVFFTGIIRDITMRKHAEAHIREQDLMLISMDRIAGINSLAAGIAHEINNPLSIISGTVGNINKLTARLIRAISFWADKDISDDLKIEYDMLIAGLSLEQTINSLNLKFDTIKRAVSRIINIVNSMKYIANLNLSDVQYIDINKRIDDIINILNIEGVRHVEFERQYAELPTVECSVSDINQCLLQVITNAIDAVDQMGKVVVTTTFSKDDGYVWIDVRDYGKGMSEKVLQKVFHPFFTTKPVGSGTGIGLTITERIIKAHGGTIDICSEEGRGTTVRMRLPVRQSPHYCPIDR
ncbi:MAG: PAS domain S-box protein [Nitrospirota bacterium]